MADTLVAGVAAVQLRRRAHQSDRASGGPRRWAALALPVALVLVSACAPLNRRIIAHEVASFHGVTVSGVREESFNVNADILKSLGLTNSFVAGKVEVRYDKDHAWLATGFAQEMSGLVSAVEARTGFDYRYRLRLYLVPVNDDSPQTYRFNLTAKERVLEMPVFFRPDTQSLVSLFEQDQVPLCYIFHELTEENMGVPVSGTPVLPDAAFLFIQARNYTRWFREGLSDFASYAAIVAVRKDLGAHVAEADSASLTLLSRAGADLFRWHQMSPAAKNAYYHAAFTLFFLIDKRWGDDAIRKITAGVKTLKYADGDALAALVSGVIGTDVKKMVSDMRIGDLGIAFQAYAGNGMASHAFYPFDMFGVWVAGIDDAGPAAKAGIQAGDRILTANGEPVREFGDLVFALYASLSKPAFDLTVLRGGYEKTASIPVLRSAAQPRPASRREKNPLEDFHHFSLAIQTTTRYWGAPEALLP